MAGLLSGVLLTVAAGCAGEKKEKPVFPVHGRLTHDGKPMAKAMISYYSVDASDRGAPSHATADDDGRYEMYTYRTGDGVPAGDYIVTIIWPGPRGKKDAPANPADMEADTSTPDRLKGEYAQAGKSKLRATVREQQNEIDFKLP